MIADYALASVMIRPTHTCPQIPFCWREAHTSRLHAYIMRNAQCVQSASLMTGRAKGRDLFGIQQRASFF